MISHFQRPNTTLTIWLEILWFRQQCFVTLSTLCTKLQKTTSIHSRQTMIRMLINGLKRSILISIHRLSKLSIELRVISLPPKIFWITSNNSTYLYLKRLRKLKPKRMHSKQDLWTYNRNSKNAQLHAIQVQLRSVQDSKRYKLWCIRNQPPPTTNLILKLN